MQLSNEPAEELADHLIKGSEGVFESCGFVSGGLFNAHYWFPNQLMYTNRLGSNGGGD